MINISGLKSDEGMWNKYVEFIDEKLLPNCDVFYRYLSTQCL